MTPSKKVVNTEKQEEREAYFKLVLKIISWKNGLLEGGSVKSANKITAKEWKEYYKYSLEINATKGKEKTKETLKETKALIEKHGGFEEPID